MEWVRGEILGRGSFGAVNLAIPRSGCGGIPRLMAVKSAVVAQSSSLQSEKEILTRLRNCPCVLQCFGDDFSVEKGKKLYNVFLEYAPGGTLADLLKISGGRFPESDIRRYARSILKGLRDIHEEGYVHCDIKLQNILVCSSSDDGDDIKIGDFGLARKAQGGAEAGANAGNGVSGLRGTPLYMSPESVARSEYEPPSDVWSLGCAVAEMAAGKPAWRCRPDTDAEALLFRIGFGKELPEIPRELSERGRDFLERCFVRNPSKRWTAQMLLNHPFVADDTVSLPHSDKPSPSPSRSPRSAFDFPEWTSPRSSSVTSSFPSSTSSRSQSPFASSTSSPADRIRELVTVQQPDWSNSNSWITVRDA